MESIKELILAAEAAESKIKAAREAAIAKAEAAAVSTAAEKIINEVEQNIDLVYRNDSGEYQVTAVNSFDEETRHYLLGFNYEVLNETEVVKDSGIRLLRGQTRSHLNDYGEDLIIKFTLV